MLILTRFKDESIIMSTPLGRVEVAIIHVGRDGKVRLGIDAPGAITIHRTEIQLRIDKEIQSRIDKENSQKGVTDGAITNLPG